MIDLGDITVRAIVEQQAPFMHVNDFFPDLDAERLEPNRHWMEPDFLDTASQGIVLCVQSYLVKTKHHTILVDACVGNHKPRPTRPAWDRMTSDRYERNFKAAGVTFEEIDYVMCTHLHTDHVGWNTRLENGRWVPTFPNAKYLFADRELAHWTERAEADPKAHPWIVDSVLPVVASRQAEIVKSDHVLGDNVSLLPSPGHSIDHYSVLVGRSGADALITGDMVHSPIQTRYPELGMFTDHDSVQAGETRRNLFGRFCDTSTLICTAHFPAPSTGRVTRWEDGFWIG